MSLGVLNNISALYAENNLNQTQGSLQNTLTQLSSGSRINSGADDAAGLSLANGLQANSAALTQSATNASEGVGLLQVADGALSQVTNLLNRAVTLATEASNGTLNADQAGAANSEFQSILDEISNIGSTTTYNGQQVFGAAAGFAIFTGDGTVGGGFSDTISLAALSSASVGDSTGSAGLTYTSGAGTATSTLVYAPVAANSVDLSTDSLTTSANAQTAAANGIMRRPPTLELPARAGISCGRLARGASPSYRSICCCPCRCSFRCCPCRRSSRCSTSRSSFHP